MHRTRGRGPTKEEWYSICSRHRIYDSECKLCNVGRWVNVWRHACGGVVYAMCPWLWRKWVNRKNSPDRKLELYIKR